MLHPHPTLRYADAPAMIDWLCRALGFTRRAVYPNPDGTIAHAELVFETTGMLMLGSVRHNPPFSDVDLQPRDAAGRNTHGLYLVSPRTADLFAQSTAAGAEIVLPLRTMDYGGLAFTIRDPEGYLWSVGEYDPWHSSPQPSA